MTESFEQKKLYLKVKRYICQQIYNDVYADGDYIPSERKLAEDLGVSRVTVRKALDLLEEEQIIDRQQGSGTRVALYYGPRNREMDVITIVAPAENYFFSRFMGAFQTEAEKCGSLVMYKQAANGSSLSDCLFKIYEKGFRNVVIWPEDLEICPHELKKLTGLGMNLVFFDSPLENPYADCVCIDNKHAIRSLHEILKIAGCRKIAYVGWEQMRIGNIAAREKFFRELEPDGRICRIPWKYSDRYVRFPDRMMEEIMNELEGADGVLYSIGEFGAVLEKYFRSKGVKRHAVMFDRCPEADDLGIYSLEQDFESMTKRILSCLAERNSINNAPEPQVYFVDGKGKESSRFGF